jgi:hypothetical protein
MRTQAVCHMGWPVRHSPCLFHASLLLPPSNRKGRPSRRTAYPAMSTLPVCKLVQLHSSSQASGSSCYQSNAESAFCILPRGWDGYADIGIAVTVERIRNSLSECSTRPAAYQGTFDTRWRQVRHRNSFTSLTAKRWTVPAFPCSSARPINENHWENVLRWRC